MFSYFAIQKSKKGGRERAVMLLCRYVGFLSEVYPWRKLILAVNKYEHINVPVSSD